MSTQLEKFDIRNHLDKLEPGKGKNFYTCPVCANRRLGIDPKSGKYQCWSGGCGTNEIREAIRPLAEFLAERNGERSAHQPRKSKAKKQEYPPVPIPVGAELLMLPVPGQSPQPEELKDAPRRVPHNALQITYEYSPTQKVVRYEWPDATNPKGRDKTYSQFHIDPDGKKDWTKGDARWPAYPINEIVELLESIPDGEPIIILILEGEPNVELAKSIGIAALTLQGSNWSHPEIQIMLETLRATGKNVSIAVLRDNDDTGIKKGQEVWLVARHIGFPCIVVDPRSIYPDIPEAGDIREILEAIEPDEFLNRLSAEIDSQSQNFEQPANLLERSFDQESDGNNVPTKSKTKLSMQEAAEQAREILLSGSNELATNINLEEVRQKAGIGDYSWEHKIIKPLKRDMDGERFKLELLSLMQMEDPVERCRLIALLAPKYNMRAGEIKEAMAAMKEHTTTPEPRLWSLSEVFNLQSEGLQWIIPELLPCAETVILSACPKAGKSLIGVDLAFCMATGEEKFLGKNIKVGKVLLVSVDESLNSTRSKLEKRGFRLQDNDNIKILPQWNITQTAKLESFLEDYRPDVVIIDSLKRICKGSAVSENSAEFSDNIYDLKELLTRYGAAGVLIHHSNKNPDALGVDRLRGSSAIAGSVWGVWQVDHIPKKDPNNSKKLIIDPKDPKRIFLCFPRDAEGQTLDIELNLENNSWLCHGLAGEEAETAKKRETIRERILRTLKKHNRPLPGPEIIELAELAEQRGSAYSELNRMVGNKVISAAPAPGDKRYTLYSLPNCQAEFLSAKAPPPPSPPSSLPIAIYESENHIEKGFQIDSKIDSRYIAIDSTVTVESEMLSTANDCEDRVSEIDSNSPLAQGGRGVEVELQPPIDPEISTLAQPPADVPAVSHLNEDELELVEMIRLAIAEPDAEIARQVATNILPVLKEVCAKGAANREKVFLIGLIKEEQEIFNSLVGNTKPERASIDSRSASPIAPDDKLQEPEALQSPPHPEIIAPADAEKLRDIATIWWVEYFPEHLQTLITQVFGWGAPGTRYDAATITAWLTTEDAVVRDRISELIRRRSEGSC